MKTYPIKDGNNRTFAFEIGNVYVGPGVIANLLRRSGKVVNLKRRKAFHSPADVHIDFQYGGVDFIVWEPYADSSRYWIGPKDDANRTVGIEDLESVFARYRPPRWRKIAGDLLTLNFASLFGRE